MKLRLGFVVPRFHPQVLGGAELHARWLATHLAMAGHRVEVFTTCALSTTTWQNVLPAGEEREGPVSVRRHLADPPDHRERGELDARIRLGQSLSSEEERRWLLSAGASAALESDLAERVSSLDAVLGLPYLAATTWGAFQAARDRFVLIPCLHDEPFARLRFTQELLGGARGLLFNTPPELDLARSLVPRLAPSAIVGLGLAPPAPADPDAFCSRHRLRQPFAVYMGRLESGKNVPLLLRYFRCYRDRRGGTLTLLLVGDGDVQPPPDSGIRKLAIDWKERGSMLAASTVLIQPSLNESFSIVMMQAWLCERPVLVHARAAVPRYHCGLSRGGLWFASYAEFEAMLDLLQSDPALAARLGACGRAYVERECAWPAVLGRFERALAAFGFGRGG